VTKAFTAGERRTALLSGRCGTGRPVEKDRCCRPEGGATHPSAPLDHPTEIKTKMDERARWGEGGMCSTPMSWKKRRKGGGGRRGGGPAQATPSALIVGRLSGKRGGEHLGERKLSLSIIPGRREGHTVPPAPKGRRKNLVSQTIKKRRGGATSTHHRSRQKGEGGEGKEGASTVLKARFEITANYRGKPVRVRNHQATLAFKDRDKQSDWARGFLGSPASRIRLDRKRKGKQTTREHLQYFAGTLGWKARDHKGFQTHRQTRFA